MPLKTRITIIFILLTGLLQILIFLSIYFFAKEYTENEFYLRLSQRATIAAQVYLEKDEVTIEIYEAIRLRHLQTLPGEKEVIYPVNTESGIPPKELKANFPSQFLRKVFEEKYAETKKGDFYFTGLLYNDNQGDFLVLLSAKDLYGLGKLENLRNILVVAFLISMVFISILGQYFAQQALSPISKIIRKVNTIRAENLNLRLERVRGKGELSDLTQTFNNMLDRLETSFEMKNNFVQNASHELKNPLTAIIGQAETALANSRNNEGYISALEAIETEANRLNSLLNSLLRLAYTDQDSKGLKIDMIRIDEILIDLKSNLDNVNSRRLNYCFQDLPKNADDLILKGNQSLIVIALMNIVDNALKYSSGNQVDISVHVEERVITVKIEDQGIGIPEKDLNSVFEPFYRGSNARTFKGFGFGLSLSDKIVRLHGGVLSIDSKLGKGTTVSVELPNIFMGYEIAR
ncbi:MULTISPECIES: sensor histidine kinase [Maribacter]|uniref:histidine kinase n=1 Tax=Maribacter flavus TaxID=1658664 RepID=A0ABU7IIY8_9FLAO|nr:MULTISPECIES: HAMP domain-containing sensor histidine kinase [Maribacter]MDC6405827.1 HAMP domain-containing sensor histidine kinase [Maribacter sp. PR66]MEE1972921.1 HAMP domain-containing sensor histidine kinase [Maribacter flavus]